MRSHLLWLLDCNELKEIGQKCPTLTDDELAAYEAAKGKFFTRQNFRIDFGVQWKRSPFNMEARDVFIKHFIQSVAGGMYSTRPPHSKLLHYDQVGDVLDAHLSYLRREYRKTLAPKSDVDREAEQAENAMRSRKATVSIAASDHGQVLLTICSTALFFKDFSHDSARTE